MFFRRKRKAQSEVRELHTPSSAPAYPWNPLMPGETRLFMTLLGDNQPAELQVGEHSYGPLNLLFYPNDIHAKLRVGRYCCFADGITIFLGVWGTHFHDTATTYPLAGRFGLPPDIINSSINSKDMSVEIGSDVWIGRNVTIMAGVSIGHGAVIGTESLVSKDVEPYTIVAGNPARPIRKRFSDEIISRMLAVRWWDWPDDVVVENIAALQTNDMGAAIELIEVAGSKIERR